MLKVNEIFLSIQGEGMYTGTPAVFIRLMGCPCHCPWCDTPHTWNAMERHEVPFDVLMSNKGGDDSKEYDMQWATAAPQEIIQAVNRVCQDKSITHVVITGGEPLMQVQGISELLPELYSIGAQSVQMETSGYIGLSDDEIKWLQHVTSARSNQLHVTCSPKAPIDKPFFDIVSEWKLTVEDPVSELTLMLMGRLQGHNYGRNYVFLQPVDYGDDGTAEASIKRAKNIASLHSAINYCMKYGYRLSLQTHKFIGVR